MRFEILWKILVIIAVGLVAFLLGRQYGYDVALYVMSAALAALLALAAVRILARKKL